MRDINDVIKATRVGAAKLLQAIERELEMNGVTDHSELLQCEYDWYLADQMKHIMELQEEQEASK